MIRRLLYRSFRLAYHLKRWVFGRFTRAGLLLLAGTVSSALYGLDTNRTVAYQAFALLFFLLALAVVSSRFFRGRFTALRTLPRFGTVGRPISYRLKIDNLSSKTEDGLLVIEDLEESLPTLEEFLATRAPGEDRRNRIDRAIGYHRWLWMLSKRRRAKSEESTLPSLPPGGRAELVLDILPSRRGSLSLNRLTIARPDPFGLYKSLTTVSARQSVLVLPRRYAVPPVQLPGVRKHQPGGVALASSVGESDEFVSLRDYRPGDPLRRIHWKSWAKTGRPIVKEYEDEFFVRHALVLDTFHQAPDSDIFEEAVCVAASFAWTVQSQDSLLDLMFVGPEAYCFTSGRGLAHVDRMLEILASVEVCRDKPFRSLLPLVLERASLLSACICVFLSWDDERKELVGMLKGLGLPLKVLVVADQTSPEVLDPGPMQAQPQDLHRLEVGRIEEGLAAI